MGDGEKDGVSIGGYLIQRLRDHGLGDVFGVPGDYVLAFYELLDASPIRVVSCTREDCAGFAADAYARINGLGAVCVTYCVGGLSVCNSIAGAYAEKSPVVMISGAPGLSERVNNPLLHHKVRDFRTQMDVFEKLCVAGTDLSDPVSAFREIDRVLEAAVRFRRPVYIEIPRDQVNVVPHISHAFKSQVQELDLKAAGEAADEAARLLNAARKPVIIAGVEIHRFGLQDKLLQLAEDARIPIAATVLGKSVIRETHPLYIGLYGGGLGDEEVTTFVEESDCVLLLGTFMTDINLGIYTANLDPVRCIYSTSESLQIQHHFYQAVPIELFLDQLIARSPCPASREIPASIHADHREPYVLQADNPITISRMMERIDEQIDDNTIVIADIGDSLFAAMELTARDRTDFLSPAYYTSMGFSVPATLGAQCARPNERVLTICGDGAFQMTGMELSSIVRYGFSPVVIVLNNQGYGTERFLHPGDWQYNEIHGWNYHKLPNLLGGGRGYEVRTEGEFDQALNAAWKDRSGFSLLHVHVDRNDGSQTLKRLAEKLGQRI